MPEIIIERTAFHDVGNAGARVVDREKASVQGRVIGGGGQLGKGNFILRLDPSERLGAFDLFEPLVGIIDGRGGRRGGSGEGGGREHSE